jgi:hypothetical protein
VVIVGARPGSLGFELGGDERGEAPQLGQLVVVEQPGTAVDDDQLAELRRLAALVTAELEAE